jgi:hypothetical protein
VRPRKALDDESKGLATHVRVNSLDESDHLSVCCLPPGAREATTQPEEDDRGVFRTERVTNGVAAMACRLHFIRIASTGEKRPWGIGTGDRS